MPRPTNELRELARIGAEVRIKELEEQLASLRRIAGLTVRMSDKPGAGTAPTLASSSSPAPRRRKMSAAARKRISEAQKKRWAKRRAKKT